MGALRSVLEKEQRAGDVMSQTTHEHHQPSSRYCPRCAAALEERVVGEKLRPQCPNCGHVVFPDPKVAVAVVVGKEGKVLLTKRNHEPGMGLWSFPSGYMDAGEKAELAGVREVKEETNLDVRIDQLLGVYSEEGSPVVLIVYGGSPLGGEPAPGPEAEAVGFFDPTDLPELAFDHDAAIVQAWSASIVR